MKNNERKRRLQTDDRIMIKQEHYRKTRYSPSAYEHIPIGEQN